MKATSGIAGTAANSSICGRCATGNGLPSMHLSARINVARPVSSRVRVTDHFLEADRTTDIHLEDVIQALGAAGVNSSAVAAFCCLYCCQCLERVVVDLYFKLNVCRVPEFRLTIPRAPLFQIPNLNTARKHELRRITLFVSDAYLNHLLMNSMSSQDIIPRIARQLLDRVTESPTIIVGRYLPNMRVLI